LNCFFTFFGNTHYFGHNANLFIGIKKTISAHGVSNLEITGEPLSANSEITLSSLATGMVYATCCADGGGVEKRSPGNWSSLFIQRLKIYSDVQKSSFCPSQSQ